MIALTARRRRLVLVLVALVLAAGGTGGWLLLREEPAAAKPTTTTVAKQTVKDTVAATGTVAAATSEDLAFEVSGVVAEVYVAGGDRVRAGDPVARVDAAALRAARSAAVSTLEAARAQLEEDTDADASDVQVAADQAAVVAAGASLDEADAAVRGAVLRATTRGTVTAVGIEVGDTTGTDGGTSDSGDGSITVTSSNRFVVDATVSSSDVERLEEGQQAEVAVTGVDETVYGTVESIGLVAETSSSGAAVFPVTIEVTGTRDDLYAGTSAEASVVVAQEEGVLTVASRAVQTYEDGTTYVDRVADGEPVRTEVEIGRVYGMVTEVLSGLDEGDVVEVPALDLPDGGGGDGGREDMIEQLEEGGFPPGGQGGSGQLEGPVVVP